MRLVVAVAIVALVAAALVGGGFGGWLLTKEEDEAAEGPAPAPGGFRGLPYDQQHSVCQEAARTVEETAKALGRVWPRAQSMFYDQCMACGGPTEVLAHADPDWRLTVECATEGGLFPKAKAIPEGHTQIWP